MITPQASVCIMCVCVCVCVSVCIHTFLVSPCNGVWHCIKHLDFLVHSTIASRGKERISLKVSILELLEKFMSSRLVIYTYNIHVQALTRCVSARPCMARDIRMGTHSLQLDFISLRLLVARVHIPCGCVRTSPLSHAFHPGHLHEGKTARRMVSSAASLQAFWVGLDAL